MMILAMFLTFHFLGLWICASVLLIASSGEAWLRCDSVRDMIVVGAGVALSLMFWEIMLVYTWRFQRW